MSLTVAVRVAVRVRPTGQSTALLHRANATHGGRLLLLDCKMMDILTRLTCTFLKVLLVKVECCVLNVRSITTLAHNLHLGIVCEIIAFNSTLSTLKGLVLYLLLVNLL